MEKHSSPENFDSLKSSASISFSTVQHRPVLCASSSQRRVRTLASSQALSDEHAHILEHGSNIPASSLLFKLPDVFHRITSSCRTNRLRWTKSWVKWIFLGYCFLCVFFMSGNFALRVVYSSRTQKPKLSPISSLSPRLRFSKMSSTNSLSEMFTPFAISGSTLSSPVTACLWAQEHDLTDIPNFASAWDGPISVLLTTSTLLNSGAQKSLLTKLEAIGNSSLSVSIHILYLQSPVHDASNAYLNLARLFSSTPHVVLFPGPPSLSLPAGLSASSVGTKHGPVILLPIGSSLSSESLEPPSFHMAPIMLSRDHSSWCTERFFFTADRSINWDQCFWQIWLETFGQMSIFSAVPSSSGSFTPPVSKPARRLITKFREEMCIFATNQQASLVSSQVIEDQREMRKKTKWLKAFCREHLAMSTKDL